MNYELTMLKNVVRAQKSAQSIAHRIRLLAMRSYDTAGFRNGTLGQVQKLQKMCCRAELFNGFCRFVKKALNRLPAGVRALLVEVYVKNRSRSDVAKRCGVNVGKVYRKLFAARKLFRDALEKEGCTERFFNESYGCFDWLCNDKD